MIVGAFIWDIVFMTARPCYWGFDNTSFWV